MNAMKTDKIHSGRGFTIIELMVTVVIIGVVSAVAAPRFSKEVDRIKFRAQTKEFVSQLRSARSLAITEKIPHGVYFDHDNLVITIFEDISNPSDHTFDAGSDPVVSSDSLPPPFVYLYATFANSAVVFQPNGSASESGAIYLLTSGDNNVNFSQVNVLASTGKSNIGSINYY
jgi:prepilin-type N-terminal cleavage/methylation domain-containing protein